VFILLVLSLILVRGTQESAFVNGVIVITKVAIVLMVIGLGWGFMNPANHVPFIPRRRPTPHRSRDARVRRPHGNSRRGRRGVLRVHRVDAVSTAAQEAKIPRETCRLAFSVRS